MRGPSVDPRRPPRSAATRGRRLTPALAWLALSGIACGGGGGSPPCAEGRVETCPCGPGVWGSQVCSGGAFGACECVADDGGPTPDVGVADSGTDAPATDAAADVGAVDTGTDARPVDSGADGAPDDAAPDARVGDSGPDAGADAGGDAGGDPGPLEYCFTPVTTTGVPTLSHGVGVYDAAHEETLWLGGVTGPVEAWAFDGASWTLKPATMPPSARIQLVTAFDRAHGVVMVFGGGILNVSTAYDETFTWDGATWVAPPVTTRPSARWSAAGTYDERRRRVVMFGGNSGAAETWEWDGSAWTPIRIPPPPGRYWHVMAFDVTRGQTVLFGGHNTSDFGDTWTYDGTRWALSDAGGPASPRPRSGAQMAWDPRIQRVVLFGGVGFGPPGSGRTELGDTWLWDGARWREATCSAGAPLPRGWGTMVYDEARSQMVLYGGEGGIGVYLKDTWVVASSGVPALPPP